MVGAGGLDLERVSQMDVKRKRRPTRKIPHRLMCTISPQAQVVLSRYALPGESLSGAMSRLIEQWGLLAPIVEAMQSRGEK